ncbi:hypothetical protein PVAP13_1KG445405, partial [Panicum virgatum]
KKKNLEDGYNCALCQEGLEETAEHLLFNCSSAVCRWFSLDISWEENASIHQQIHIAKQEFAQPLFMEIFMIGAWCIWNERNDYVFNNKVPNFSSWKSSFKPEV